MKCLFSLASCVLMVGVVLADAADACAKPKFQFVLSYDAKKNAANVSHFLDAPAGKHGFVRVKGVPLELTLPAATQRVKCWALAPDGERMVEVPVKDVAGRACLEVGPANRTLWYEIAIAKEG